MKYSKSLLKYQQLDKDMETSKENNMHYVTAKGILSAKNGMNLCRGCSNACIYCDSPSKCYHMEHQFEDIEIKENTIELLEKVLKHRRKKSMIGTGSMTDPILILKKKYKV